MPPTKDEMPYEIHEQRMLFSDRTAPQGPPPPGSDFAFAAGCTCPRPLNNYGNGGMRNAHGMPVFYVDPNCPLHGSEFNA